MVLKPCVSAEPKVRRTPPNDAEPPLGASPAAASASAKGFWGAERVTFSLRLPGSIQLKVRRLDRVYPSHQRPNETDNRGGEGPQRLPIRDVSSLGVSHSLKHDDV